MPHLGGEPVLSRLMAFVACVVLACVLLGCAKTTAPGYGTGDGATPAADRATFLGPVAAAEQVAVAFVLALGEGRADRANALLRSPRFTSQLEGLPLSNVEAIAGAKQQRVRTGYRTVVSVPVAYISSGPSELLGSGRQTVTLTLGLGADGQWRVLRFKRGRLKLE